MIYNIIGNPNVERTLATASTIHVTNATVLAHSPQAGTHTSIHMLTSVAKPIGMQPRKRELTGSCTMTTQISGYRAYRKMDTIDARAKRIVFRMKNTIEA